MSMNTIHLDSSVVILRNKMKVILVLCSLLGLSFAQTTTPAAWVDCLECKGLCDSLIAFYQTQAALDEEMTIICNTDSEAATCRQKWPDVAKLSLPYFFKAWVICTMLGLPNNCVSPPTERTPTRTTVSGDQEEFTEIEDFRLGHLPPCHVCKDYIENIANFFTDDVVVEEMITYLQGPHYCGEDAACDAQIARWIPKAHQGLMADMKQNAETLCHAFGC